MGPVAALALLVAIPVALLAVGEVSTLQDQSKPLTSGAVNTILGTTTFMMMLTTGVVCLGAVAGVLNWILNR